MAEELAPLLIARINRQRLTDEGSALLRLISEWDYRCEGESRAATLFEQWRVKVYELTFDEMPAPLTWAEHRNSFIRHLGAIPGFGSEMITTGGARFSPRVLSGGHGASWRMVVELGPKYLALQKRNFHHFSLHGLTPQINLNLRSWCVMADGNVAQPYGVIQRG